MLSSVGAEYHLRPGIQFHQECTSKNSNKIFRCAAPAPVFFGVFLPILVPSGAGLIILILSSPILTRLCVTCIFQQEAEGEFGPRRQNIVESPFPKGIPYGKRSGMTKKAPQNKILKQKLFTQPHKKITKNEAFRPISFSMFFQNTAAPLQTPPPGLQQYGCFDRNLGESLFQVCFNVVDVLNAH
jgi:hypothetical protein